MIIEDKGYKAKVVCDSINEDSIRLLSLECTYPRFIHSEMMTHRMFARNSASSRAIPFFNMVKDKQGNFVVNPKCMYEQIRTNPVVPLSFGKEQKGMQSGDELVGEDLNAAQMDWLNAKEMALTYASQLADLGVHKSIANRLVEPFMWITVLITATDWQNFFKLRCHPDAEKHMQKIAYMMKQVYDESKPSPIKENGWHLPYIHPHDALEFGLKTKEQVEIDLRKISTGRAARLSYLTQDGTRSLEADIELHNRLMESGHWSPFEHPATPASPDQYYGCFRGWKPYRKFFANECVHESTASAN